ncbi:MAG: TonB family protein [Terriglobales bacterium]
MARNMLKPDSTRDPDRDQIRISGPEWIEPNSEEPEAGPSNVLPFKAKRDLPADFALDSQLHEILEQTRVTAASSGAVIALARGNKMVCRATLGDKAPVAGAYLNTRSGLSGACVQTREMQLCDDTLVDPRVDTAACRDLGIRSIVVQPVLDDGELWGMLEVFSLVPRAFSDSDLQALQSLSRKISQMVNDAMEGESTTLAPESVPPPQLPEPVEAEFANLELSFEAGEREGAIAGRDFRTGALTAAVLALAVLLGWMVGRVGWSMAVNRAPVQIPVTPDETQARAPVVPDARPAQSPTEEPSVPAKPVDSQARAPAATKPVSKPKVEKAVPPANPPATPPEVDGGLVVYEHGKVVFRMPPAASQTPASTEPGVIEFGAIQKAATREEDDPSAAPAAASAQSTGSYLLERVEPEYPEAARQQRIQGPVVMNVLVGTDGSVRKLTVISGDPQLVNAAADAVRQWRFKPHQLKGKVVEFETRITVNFALAE